jgi:hypothetical protein
MSELEAHYGIGDRFNVQFVWRLPDDDYLRAIFRLHVEALDVADARYIGTLEALLAGRQEAPDGSPRPSAALSSDHWARVGAFVGQRIKLAYEADDGRALHMRYATLSGEHDFFRRYDE